MKQDCYKEIVEIQKYHWWYIGRSFILKRIMARLCLKNPLICDIGFGTGANIEMLKQVGSVYACEMDADIADQTSKNFTLRSKNMPCQIQYRSKISLT